MNVPRRECKVRTGRGGRRCFQSPNRPPTRSRPGRDRGRRFVVFRGEGATGRAIAAKTRRSPATPSRSGARRCPRDGRARRDRRRRLRPRDRKAPRLASAAPRRRFRSRHDPARVEPRGPAAGPTPRKSRERSFCTIAPSSTTIARRARRAFATGRSQARAGPPVKRRSGRTPAIRATYASKRRLESSRERERRPTAHRAETALGASPAGSVRMRHTCPREPRA